MILTIFYADFTIILLVSKLVHGHFISSSSPGVHGGHMSLVTFASPGASVLELFPYALPAEHLDLVPSTIRARGSDLFYSRYASTDYRMSRKPIVYDFQMDPGGIATLHQDVQDTIR